MLSRLPTTGRISRLPSATLNRVIDDYARRSGEAVAPAEVAQLRGAADAAAAASGLVVEVENQTGADLPEMGIAGIDEAAFTPPAIGASDEADDAVLAPPVLVLAAVVEADHAEAFVVTQEPIADGETGRAVLQGVTWARVDVQNASDATAGVVTGDPDKLRSGKSGPAILWKPSGTGVLWCLVRIGGGGGGTTVAGDAHHRCLIDADVSSASWDNTTQSMDPGLGRAFLLSRNAGLYDLSDESFTITERGSSSNTAASGTTLTLTWPANLERFDFAVLLCSGKETTDGRAATPAGFTEQESVAGSDGLFLQAFTKVCDGAESGNLVVTFGEDDAHAVVLLVYVNVYEAADSASATPNTASANVPSVTTKRTNSLVLRAGVAVHTNDWSDTGGGAVELDETDIGSAFDFAVTSLETTAAGATGTDLWQHASAINALVAVALDRDARVEIENPSRADVPLEAGRAIFGELVEQDGVYTLVARDCVSDSFAFSFTGA